MYCHDQQYGKTFAQGGCGCHGSHILSKKKKVEHLKRWRDIIKEKVQDVEEYIKELEKDK